jgi:hypothetical protein
VRSADARRAGARRLVAAVAYLALAACATGGWAWRRADGPGDADRLSEDVDACEDHARIAEMGHGLHFRRNPRPWGGWGSFPFEACMHQKGWRLEYVPAE